MNKPIFTVCGYSWSTAFASHNMQIDIQVNPMHPSTVTLGSEGIVELIRQSSLSVPSEKVSPLTVQMILEASWRPAGEWPRKDSIAHIDSCLWLSRRGYVNVADGSHELTEKGKLWIERITQSPEREP